MVPVAVEFVAMEIEFGPVLVGDLDPGRIRVGVQLAAHPQPASGRGGCDQLQNDFVTNPIRLRVLRQCRPYLCYMLPRRQSQLQVTAGSYAQFVRCRSLDGKLLASCRRDCGQDLRSRLLNEMERFYERLLVAIPELNVRNRCFRSI